MAEKIQKASTDNRRVVRGGSFLYAEVHVRCACRVGYGPSFNDEDLGFRVCVTAQEQVVSTSHRGKMQIPIDEWPTEAQFVNQAGKNLQLRVGEELLTTKDIQREIERLGRVSGHNVRPPDYCYNRINKDPRSCRYPVLEWVERGRFRYLGPYYNYTGPVYWEPRGEPERQVGEWKSGVCYLCEDPRKE